MSKRRVTDKLGVVGLDTVEYPEEQTERITTLDATNLKKALSILETLGWNEVDVCAVEPDDVDNPMLVIKPPTKPLFAGEQAGIAITPRTEKGRNPTSNDNTP